MRSNQQASKHTRRKVSPSIEALEGRALLSQLASMPGAIYTTPAPTSTSASIVMPMPASTTAPTKSAKADVQVMTHMWSEWATTTHPAKSAGMVHVKSHELQKSPSGIVTKSPRFYPFYTGPKWPELNAVKASAELTPSGTFLFTGTNQGTINKAPAVYVWGLDRNGNLPPGPFTDRPNVKFDALVVVRLNSSLTPTAAVMDLTNGTTTDLPAGAASIHGHTVKVTVASGLLPSTGLAPSQYGFNYWPEDGGPPISSSVASFLPETTNAQVGTSK
jgi:hypothetical protein